MISFRLRHAFRLGMRSLASHRMRSGLTALGIVLGVASVIVMLAVGEAARYQALKQLEDLGASTIILQSVKPTDDLGQSQDLGLAYGLTYADLDRLQSTIPTVLAATPMREYRKTVRHRDRKLEARIMGVTPDFLAQNKVQVGLGRGIDEIDEKRFDNVAVLGSATAEVLFPAQNPIGQTINIETMDRPRSFLVVGVTEAKTLAVGKEGTDADLTRVVFIPFSTDRVRLGRELWQIKAGTFSVERLEISQIIVSTSGVEAVPKTASAIQSLIDQFHPRKDVLVTVPLDLLRKAEQTQRLFTLVLGSIAGISLLVGGIGIMNIMLATVTERTREIGLRMALGARQRDIATQFLAETLVLACCGGLVGVGLGIGLSLAVSEVFGQPAIVRPWSPLVAFATSLLVGLASGFYPALRAARLDPIEALRYE